MTTERGDLRVLSRPEEFSRYLHLRERIWARGHNPSDLNAYDRYSRVIAFFDPGDRLLAALRVVTPGVLNPDLEQLKLAAAPSPARQLLEAEPACRIAAEETFPITRFLSELDASGRRYVEIGRLTKVPESRDGWAIFQLMTFALEQAGLWGYHYAIASCAPGVVKLWGRYGYRPVEGIAPEMEKYTQTLAVPVYAPAR